MINNPCLFNSVSLVEHLVHGLVSQLDTQEGGSVSGHGTRQRRADTREEGLEAALAVQLLDDSANGHAGLGARLQTALDGINGENGDPHSHTGTSTSNGNGRQTQLAVGLASDGVLGGELLFDVLVGGKVGGGAGTVAGKGGNAAAEDGADTALFVEVADDIDGAVVLGLLARLEDLLALDLEDDLDALKGGGDGGHGNGGQETGSGDLANGEGAVGVGGGEVADDLLADIVAPKGDGDWER